MSYSELSLSAAIDAASLNPDRWPDVFVTASLGMQIEKIEMRCNPRSGVGASSVTCSALIGWGQEVASLAEAGFSDAAFGSGIFVVEDNYTRSEPSLAIEFNEDDALYSILIDSAERRDSEIVRTRLLNARDRIKLAVRANRALLSQMATLSWLRATLGELEEPAFLLSIDGVILWQNAAAKDKRWGEFFSGGTNKQLALARAPEQAALRARLSELAPPNSQSICHVKLEAGPAGDPALLILKTARLHFPFQTHWANLFKPDKAIIAVLRSPAARPKLSPVPLRDLYRLTAKESELALALVRGETLTDYAKAIGISVETARWHSKKVLQKMECSTQQDLIYTMLFQNSLLSILS